MLIGWEDRCRWDMGGFLRTKEITLPISILDSNFTAVS